MGLIDRDFGRFSMTNVAMYVLLAAVIVGLIGLIMSVAGRVHRGAIVGILLMMAAGMGSGTLYAQSKMKEQLPPINDVQTDWTLPVAFTEKALREREHAGSIRVRDDAVVPEGNGDWSGLSFADGVLLADPAQVDPAFAELVNDGKFKKVSACFYEADAPANPKPGSLYLRHVGFLGAQPPAIKGLKSVSFAASGTQSRRSATAWA